MKLFNSQNVAFRFIRCVAATCLLVFSGDVRAADADVLIYGATPGGVAAAAAVATGGHEVLLVEPTNRVGG